MKRHSPMMIISYDDGPLQDFTLAFPVHKRLGVPAEVNIVTSLIGTQEFMSLRQIKKLEAAGFEIIGHTCGHNSLVSRPLARPARKGDTKLYMRKVRTKNTDCRIWSEDAAEVIHVEGKGQDDHGRFAVLATPLRHNYPEGALVRLTNEAAKYEVAGSRKRLEKLGFSVHSFTYPFSEWDDESRRLVASYYQSARAAGDFGLNTWDNFNPYELRSKNFVYLSNQQIKDLLDETARKKALLIFYTHTWDHAFSAEKLEFVLREAMRRDIRIVTRRDVLAKT